MLGKRIICAAVSALLCIQAAASVFGAETAAGSNGELVFLEDYESIAEGNKPDYGTNGWSLDNFSSAPSGYSIAVVKNSNENKSLLLSFEGSGATVSSDVLICRNVSVQAGEKHTFYSDVMTADTNGNKRIFIRGSSSAQQMELIRMRNGYLYIAGEKMSKCVKKHWYRLRTVIDGDTKKAQVYVDDVLRATLYLTAYDLTNISIRASVIGEGSQGARTEMYLDNTAYTIGNYIVDFSAEQNVQNTDPAADGVLDYTPTPAPDDGTGTETSDTGLDSDMLLLCLDNTRAYHGSAQIELSAKPVNKSGELLLPLRTVAEQLGARVIWTGPDCATVTYDGTDYKIIAGEETEINAALTGKAVLENEALLVPQETIEAMFGLEATSYSSGGILLAKPGAEIASADIKKLVWELSFSEPTAERILADFENYSAGAHPRVLVDSARVEKIREWIQTDDNFAAWYARVKRLADNSLTADVCVYELRDGERLLYVSRDVYSHVVYNAFVYLIEGGDKYKDRIWKEMEAVCNFPDWHPTHFLDTSEMTLAVAICYDWLYDIWTESQRKTMRDAILRFGLDAAQSAYDGSAEYGTETGAYHNRIGWTQDYSNWGLVSNGGIAVGALAVIGDAEDEYCAEILSEALSSVKYPMSLFAPVGSWNEGISYWEYATRYMSYMFSTLMYAAGTDYGYSEVPGLVGTAYFPVYHTGPQGNFNFGDASESTVNAPVLFWFSELLDDPALAAVRLNTMRLFGNSGGIDDLLFYNPELESADSELDKERYYSGVETVMFANNWGSGEANYIGIHGGTSGATHGDLDTGVFVLDAIGERWTIDWGTDDYTLPNYFFWPGRGNYYRKRAEGHSTLVINPDSSLDQKQGATSKIEAWRGGTSGGWAILDMSPAYANDADSVKRMIAAYNDRTKFIVQDEIQMSEKSDVWWLMQTQAEIEISDDGKSAVLTKHGKHLLCQLQASDKNAVFSYTAAVPFETSPKGTGQAKNAGYRLAVCASNVKNLNIRVTFTPYLDGETPDDTLLKLVGTEQMTESNMLGIDEDVFAKADGIYANGKLLDGYNSQQFYYEIALEERSDKMPEITAVSDNYSVTSEITEESNTVSRVVITVSDESGTLKDGKYTVRITRPQTTFDTPLGSAAAVKAVMASDIPQAENTPENTLDGDKETKWAGEGIQWIQYDLGEAKTVTAVGTWWLSQTSRTQNYSILVSSDGEEWETVFDGISSKKQDSIEYCIINKENVRYVRLNVNGNSTGSWTSLLETQIYTAD